MNWSVNHSYLDVTLNICNFQYDNTYWTKGANPRFIATANYTSAVTKFNKTSYVYTPEDNVKHTLFSRSSISSKQISSQFDTWNKANKFIDYYLFSAKIGTYLNGIWDEYENYGNQKTTQKIAVNYNSTFKQGANYYIGNYDKITSKVTNSIVPANEYKSELSDLVIIEEIQELLYDYGAAVFDMSFPPVQSKDNNLYLSLWFTDVGRSEDYFYIKVNDASLLMQFNTSIFDNLYKI